MTQDLAAQEAVATAVITIKRAATGREETYTLKFTPAPQQPEPEQPKEAE